jgi:hypothetical protein
MDKRKRGWTSRNVGPTFGSYHERIVKKLLGQSCVPHFSTGATSKRMSGCQLRFWVTIA